MIQFAISFPMEFLGAKVNARCANNIYLQQAQKIILFIKQKQEIFLKAGQLRF